MSSDINPEVLLLIKNNKHLKSFLSKHSWENEGKKVKK